MDHISGKIGFMKWNVRFDVKLGPRLGYTYETGHNISLNKTRTAGLILIILLEENNKVMTTAKVKTEV